MLPVSNNNNKWVIRKYMDGSYTLTSSTNNKVFLTSEMKENTPIKTQVAKNTSQLSLIPLYKKWIILPTNTIKNKWNMNSASIHSLIGTNPSLNYIKYPNKGIIGDHTNSTFRDQKIKLSNAMKWCNKDINCGGVMHNMSTGHVWAKSKHIVTQYKHKNNWDLNSPDFNFWAKRSVYKLFCKSREH